MYGVKAASVAITKGEWLKSDTGRVRPCTSGTAEQIVGLSLDSYASDTSLEQVAFQVPVENAVEWEFDTSDTTFADSDVFTFRDLDATGAQVVAGTGGTDNVIWVTKKVSAQKGIGVLARSVYNSASNAYFVST